MELDDFKRSYFDLRARLAPFRLKTDAETVKTVSMISALLDRADVVHDGADTGGRFGWNVGHNVENYMTRATAYLTALERGEYPLRGMFCEPGIAIVDHCFVEKDGRMHLFYNRDEIGFEWDTRPADTIGHAVTDDLLHWEILPPVISVTPGRFDGYQVWSPGVAKKGDIYYMYYTGVNLACSEAICLAVSKDLYTWEKVGDGPVLYPGKDWGVWREDAWSDCRDSMVFVDQSDGDVTAYMYYCTARREEDGSVRPAVGVAVSADMVTWEDRGAYRFDVCEHAMESPFVMKHNGRYYLFYTNCGHGTAYAVSEDLISGWQSLGMLIRKVGTPANPANVPSCAEVFAFKGRWYISSAERQPGCEQYLEIHEFSWNPDGTASVGRRLEPNLP